MEEEHKQEESAEDLKKQAAKKKKKLIIATSIFLLIGLGLFFFWLFDWRFEQYTNDAYVSGNLIELNTQVAGIVNRIYVEETQFVQEGDVLVELDPTDLQFAYEQTLANLGNTIRDVAQLFENVESLKSDLKLQQANLIKAEQDYQNRINLVDVGGVSKEEFEHIQAALLVAQNQVKATEHKLIGAEVLIQNTTIYTHPRVIDAIEKVKVAYVNLKRTKVLAPSKGFIAQRKVQLGESVQPQTPLLAVVPLHEIWINANYKETQLTKMRIGQEATITADVYGSKVTYKGKVVGLNPGTGSVFSALPPQNATGNWIKIVQRLPVRIQLPESEIKKAPLMIGMSTKVTVDIRDTSGPMLAEFYPLTPLYETPIYKDQQEGVMPRIRQVFQETLGK